jgi:HEAT repeats
MFPKVNTSSSGGERADPRQSQPPLAPGKPGGTTIRLPLGGMAKLKEGERNELQQLFWSILDKKQAGFGGTALLGLYHLAACDPSVDPARLSEEAVELLRAPDASPLVQISAFQVCGLLGERRALTQAIEAAQNGQNIALRVSAIAAVGALGGRDGLVVLRSLLREANPSVRTAVRTAIKRLEPGTNG